MGIIKKCGLFGLLFVVSSIVSFIGFSDSVNASTPYDNVIDVRPESTNWHLMSGETRYEFSEPIWTEIRNAENYDSNDQDLEQFLNDLEFRMTDGSDRNIYFMFTTTNQQLHIRLYDDPNKNWMFGMLNSQPTLHTDDLENVGFRQISIQYSAYYQSLWLSPVNNKFITSSQTNFINPGSSYYFYYIHMRIDEYPEGYEGDLLDGQGDYTSEDSNWTPDIKLLQGSDWLVELSDYNFFTFDKVAFTCGEHELAPIINWEVWDITEDEDRQLIDTLIFGAPALVEYQAPKIQEDKRYEIVAYYSDCEGYTFSNASTKSFTIRKDGTLNKADYMVVCIREDFPFINIADCWAELNDYFVLLSFRVPDENQLGGGVFKDIPNGCRELQVLDEWLFTSNQEICPQFSSQTRLIITPFISFALGMMAVTFIARRQGIRSLD